MVFEVTEMPAGYPERFSSLFPVAVQPNTASYGDRGWCFFEASAAATKDFDLVFYVAGLQLSEQAQAAAQVEDESEDEEQSTAQVEVESEDEQLHVHQSCRSCSGCKVY